MVDLEIILRAHGFRKILEFSPPVFNTPSVLEVRPRDHFGDRSEVDRGSLDCDNTGRRRVSLACLFWLFFELPRVLFDEGHAFEGESDGASAVYRRRNSALECMSQRCGSSVKDRSTFFDYNLGYQLSGVDCRGLLVSAGGQPNSRPMMDSSIPNNKTPLGLALLIKLVPCTEEFDVSSELVECNTNFWSVSEDSTSLRGL